jgi:hypothetical protein
MGVSGLALNWTVSAREVGVVTDATNTAAHSAPRLKSRYNIDLPQAGSAA